MSPEAQRIAIAESVGIRLHDGDHAPSNYTFVSDLPDYLNDLNAMHEVEMMLHKQLNLWWNYMDTLKNVSAEFNPLGCGSYICTTAAQRAEAYLRTIGKWEGGADER